MNLATYGICLLVLCCGALLRAPVALAAVFCMFGLDQLAQVSHPWLLRNLAFTNYVVGSIVIAALLRKRVAFADVPRQTWLVVALYSYALLSLTWTPLPDLAWQQWRANGPYVLTVALIGPLLITRVEELRLAMRWTVVIGGALVAIILLFGEWGPRGLVTNSAGGAEETNPLALASLAGVVAAGALFVGFGRRGALEWILRLAAALLCLLLIIRSGSRGQLVAIVVALALMLPVRFRLSSARGLVPALLACAVIAIALDLGSSLYIAQNELNEERWGAARSTADVHERLQMVGALLSHWSRSAGALLFGLGNSAALDPQIVGSYPHNMPLEILGEEGIVGFAMLLALLGAVLSSFLKARKAAFDEEDAGVLAAIGAAFLFSFLLSFKQGSLLGNYAVFMTALLAIRTSGALRRSQVQADTRAAGSQQEAIHLYPNLMR